ncbi:hypothetical protein HDK64DRAFT_260543 [Phyllosticta capitalensis]
MKLRTSTVGTSHSWPAATAARAALLLQLSPLLLVFVNFLLIGLIASLLQHEQVHTAAAQVSRQPLHFAPGFASLLAPASTRCFVSGDGVVVCFIALGRWTVGISSLCATHVVSKEKHAGGPAGCSLLLLWSALNMRRVCCQKGLGDICGN